MPVSVTMGAEFVIHHANDVAATGAPAAIVAAAAAASALKTDDEDDSKTKDVNEEIDLRDLRDRVDAWTPVLLAVMLAIHAICVSLLFLVRLSRR